MSRAGLERSVPAGVPLLLDTSVVLAYLDGTEAVSACAAMVIDEFVQTGRNPATISAVTVAETLVRPFGAGAGAIDTVEAFLLHFPHLTVSAIDYAVAREAARLRSETSLRTPDALIIATAVARSVTTVVANDERWQAAIERAAPGLALVHLDAHVPL